MICLPKVRAALPFAPSLHELHRVLAKAHLPSRPGAFRAAPTDVAQVTDDLLTFRLTSITGNFTLPFMHCVSAMLNSSAGDPPAKLSNPKVIKAAGRTRTQPSLLLPENHPLPSPSVKARHWHPEQLEKPMENRGFEPLTSAVRSQRSTS